MLVKDEKITRNELKETKVRKHDHNKCVTDKETDDVKPDAEAKFGS